MLRHTPRLCRLTFEALLCGTNPGLPPPPQLAVAVAKATETFRTQCSSSAPLPVALAATTVASLLMARRLREAAGVLALHPHQPQVLSTVRAYVGRHPDVLPVATLRDMSEEAKCIGPAAVTTFLQSAAERLSAGEAAGSEGSAEEREMQREELRATVVRHARFHPSSAATLLRPLCLLTNGTGMECEDVMETLRVSMRLQRTDPADFGYVLEALMRGKEARRVAHLWLWMQHTSACWDVRAVSAAVMAFASVNQLDDAVVCMQRMAEAGSDPSHAAQVALIHYLGTRSPPLPRYAQQLIDHWYPSPEQLWRGVAQEVGVELLRLLTSCGSHDTAIALMTCAYQTNADAPAELHALLRRSHVPALGRRYASVIATSQTLQQLFMNTVIETPSVACDRPALVGLLLYLGFVTSRLPEVYTAVESLSLNATDFQAAIDFFVRGGAVKAASAQDVLACLEEMSSRTGHVVPEELRAWLQLAKDI